MKRFAILLLLLRIPVTPGVCVDSWKFSIPIGARGQPGRVDRAGCGVLFLDPTTLVAYQIEPTNVLSARGSDKSASFQLHLIMLDRNSGRLLREAKWPTRLRASSVSLTSAGLLVRADRELLLYSKELKQLASHTLPAGDDPWHDVWFVKTSPSGRSILLVHSDARRSYYELRDGQDFRLLKNWENSTPTVSDYFSISDSGIVRPDGANQHLLYTQFAALNQVVIGQTFKTGCAISPFFVTEDLIVNVGCDITLLAVTGNVLFGSAVRGAVVDTHLVSYSKITDRLGVLLITGTAPGVLDRDSKTQAYRIHLYAVSKEKGSDFDLPIATLPQHNFAFAFTSDGTGVAILTDGTLSFCQLSSTGAEQQR